jgi:serine/threonine-protein kinase
VDDTPKRLGRHEILCAIASGGMARVWAARRVDTGQIVAIKTMLPALANDPSSERMFRDEARIAATIHHPNVCELWEFGEHDGVLYLVMEWIDGDSSIRLVRPEGGGECVPLAPRLAARIIADACAGIHAAHEQRDATGRPLGIVHRDLSPHNVLVARDGTVKVADFGIAKAVDRMQEATGNMGPKGKVPYMAPEYLMREPIDRRADVFALGCSLYELTLGCRAFRGATSARIISQILAGGYEPPGALSPGYPPKLADIIARAMKVAADDRFATAAELGRALEGYLDSSGPPITREHIGVLVNERLGAKLALRRARIMQGG